MTMTRKIASISFLEPQIAKGKSITGVMIRRKTGTAEGAREITRIEHREDYRGDHSVFWFDVYAGDEHFLSVNERAVALVEYADD